MNVQTNAMIQTAINSDNSLTKEQKLLVLAAIRSAVLPHSDTHKSGKYIMKWREAAERLGFSKVTVRKLAHMGKLKTVSLMGDRACGVTTESVENFIINAALGSTYENDNLN